MFTTSDSAFVVWVSWKKNMVPLPVKKDGKTFFRFKDLSDEQGAAFLHEYEQSEFFQFSVRYKALTARIREG